MIRCSELALNKFQLQLDLDKIQYQEHLRMLNKQPEFRKTFKAMDNYYSSLSECTITIPEELINYDLFDHLFKPEMVLPSSLTTNDDIWRLYYSQFLVQRISTYNTNIEYKKNWLHEQVKPFASLLFIMKKWSQAIARFTLGCACYVIGGFTAKYAIQEKELKNLTTSLALCAGGSYCIGQAANALAECLHYKKIIEAHLQEAELHTNYLNQKNKQLINYINQLTEKKLSQDNMQKESPLVPRHAETQAEEEGIHL